MISSLLGIIRFYSLSLAEKLALLILTLNVIVDVFATKDALKNVNNTMLYSIFTLFEITMTITIYAVENKKINLTLPLLPLLIFAAYNLLYLQGPNEFNTFTYIPGCLLVFVISYLNIRKLLLLDKLTSKNFIHWFYIANFIYYSLTIPSIINLPIVTKINAQINVLAIGKYFLDVNKILYSIWAVTLGMAFLWKPRRNI